MTHTARPDAELLGPEWFAVLYSPWRAQGCAQARELLSALDAAQHENTPDLSILRLQQVLRGLGLENMLVFKLILTRYTHHIRVKTPQPAPKIAAEVLCTLLEIRTVDQLPEYQHNSNGIHGRHNEAS